jgi:hypothetical protein
MTALVFSLYQVVAMLHMTGYFEQVIEEKHGITSHPEAEHLEMPKWRD